MSPSTALDSRLLIIPDASRIIVTVFEDVSNFLHTREFRVEIIDCVAQLITCCGGCEISHGHIRSATNVANS
jgi:hypothetical protein